MSKFAQFMKANKIKKANGFYAATSSLCDENGQPLLWEFRHISSREVEEIREDSMGDLSLDKGVAMPKMKMGKYVSRLIAAAVVFPDLQDTELQNSYGVITPEDLLLAMVDDPGEYNCLGAWVQKFLGLTATFEDKVGEAKN